MIIYLHLNLLDFEQTDLIAKKYSLVPISEIPFLPILTAHRQWWFAVKVPDPSLSKSDVMQALTDWHGQIFKQTVLWAITS